MLIDVAIRLFHIHSISIGGIITYTVRTRNTLNEIGSTSERATSIMSEDFAGIQIYAVAPVRDIHDYLESRSRSGESIDIDASLAAYEAGIRQTLQDVYPGARILVRRSDFPTPDPPRTRVESTRREADTGEIEQEIEDLIAEFDITSCIVHQK